MVKIDHNSIHIYDFSGTFDYENNPNHGCNSLDFWNWLKEKLMSYLSV